VAAVRGQSAGKQRPRQQQGAEPARNPVRNHRIAYTARSLQTQNKARHSLGNRSPIDPNQTSNSVSSRLRPGRKLGSAGARLNVISNSRMRARIKRTTFRPAIRRSHFGGEGFGFRHPVRLSRSSLRVSLGLSRSVASLADGFRFRVFREQFRQTTAEMSRRPLCAISRSNAPSGKLHRFSFLWSEVDSTRIRSSGSTKNEKPK